jgi:hypothetical protein
MSDKTPTVKRGDEIIIRRAVYAEDTHGLHAFVVTTNDVITINEVLHPILVETNDGDTIHVAEWELVSQPARPSAPDADAAYVLRTVVNEVSVTIGRNVGDTPMSREDWAGFRQHITAALKELEPQVIFEYLGEGEWHGVKEESARIVALFPVRHDAATLAYLRRFLKSWAALYDQDAIALSLGVSELVEP